MAMTKAIAPRVQAKRFLQHDLAGGIMLLWELRHNPGALAKLKANMRALNTGALHSLIKQLDGDKGIIANVSGASLQTLYMRVLRMARDEAKARCRRAITPDYIPLNYWEKRYLSGTPLLGAGSKKINVDGGD